MNTIDPARPVLPWLGGKTRLSKHILPQIEAIPHKTYAEPFVGMGGVFLARNQRPKCEVANDRNGEITNLFRILQQHYPYLMDYMRFQVASRREFERLRQTKPETLTDRQRAARFLYLQSQSFGGKPGGTFGVAKDRPARFSLAKLEPLLDAAHTRLDGVVLENLDWRDLLRRYDGPNTLFYLDPPYYGNEKDYGKDMFGRDQFDQMAEDLRALKGKFLLSINDRPEVRDLFDGCHMEPLRLKYTVARNQATEAKELLISG